LEEWETYDAIASIGMVEHVGAKNLSTYFQKVSDLLKPGGLFLNHGICLGAMPITDHSESFIDKFVFPDSELLPISLILNHAKNSLLEIRDVENLREHYTLTLRHWVKRLEDHYGEALNHVDETIYRIWRIYMAGSAHAFNVGNLNIYQTLLAKLDSHGKANMPLTRNAWYSNEHPSYLS
jgi:cyclopropane-fatty-acyl-phospholipid synthase